MELKCFRKFSNRAQDLDMYDVWVDITRLNGLDDFQVKRFICLTDHDKYPNGKHGVIPKSLVSLTERNTRTVMFLPLRVLGSGKVNQKTMLSPFQKTLLLTEWKRTGGFISSWMFNVTALHLI